MFLPKKSRQNRQLGQQGEKIAKRWLEKNKGWDIIAQNWRQGSFAEIDLIAIDWQESPPILIAVEVKTRSSLEYGRGWEAITPRKLHSLRRSFAMFAKQNPSLPTKRRIDLVDILRQGEGFDIRYYRNVG